MQDGSRHFVSLPENSSPSRLLRHVFGLGLAFPYFYLPGAIEVWIDFWYRGNRFTINSQLGEYWFFVKDPNCSERVLEQVASHFEKLLVGAST